MKKYLGYLVGAVVIAAFGVYFWLTGQNGQSGSVADNSGGTSSAQTPGGISAGDIGGTNPNAGGGTTSGGTTGGTGSTGTGSSGQYKDGTYTGPVSDAIYGQLQVVATISGGKIIDVTYPVYPDSPGHTSLVSGMALPQLKQEAIAAQSANVNIVSGATQTSEAFQQSLAAALSQAKS